MRDGGGHRAGRLERLRAELRLFLLSAVRGLVEEPDDPLDEVRVGRVQWLVVGELCREAAAGSS